MGYFPPVFGKNKARLLGVNLRFCSEKIGSKAIEGFIMNVFIFGPFRNAKEVIYKFIDYSNFIKFDRISLYIIW